jgi:RNA polymerase sigma factor (TIGR02999 family)
MDSIIKTEIGTMLTGIGVSLQDGELESLLSATYDELYRVARNHFVNQGADHTLQPTALVNEAYLKLAGRDGVRITDRGHWITLCSRIMRQVLVDHARARKAAKRGGEDWARVTMSIMQSDSIEERIDVLALETALVELNALSPARARLVELKFFGGFSTAEAAEALSISERDAYRQWRVAKAWLASRLDGP